MNRHTQGVGLWNQVDCYSQLERVVPCYDNDPRHMKRRLFPFFALHRRWVLIMKSALIVLLLIATSQFAFADQMFDDVLARAESGNTAAQYNLGLLYEKGQGVSQDHEKSVSWYTKAAETGQADAQCNLGAMYLYGLGVTQDSQKAVSWLSKSAEQGRACGQFYLGLMYAKGLGVEQDEGKAVDWYGKVAAGKYAEATNRSGMPANPPCDDVLTRAAQQSEPGAMLELLGGCLAAPAKPGVHIHVAVEMARIALQSGDREDTARYLDLLRNMLESDLRSTSTNPMKSQAEVHDVIMTDRTE